MKTPIGVIQSIVGKFYEKDASGNVMELKVGDRITENKIIFGDTNNPASAAIKITMVTDHNHVVTLYGSQEQLFDASLVQDASTVGDVIAKESVLTAWNAGILTKEDAVSDDAKDKKDDIVNDETAAGNNQVKSHSTEDLFALLDGNTVRASSTLRDAPFDNLGTTSDNNGSPIVPKIDNPSLLQNDIGNTDEDTTLTVTAANGVLSNDTDVDNILSVATFKVAGDNTVYNADATATILNVGTIKLNVDGSYVFTPALNYDGPVPVVSYTTNTGLTADLTITINPIPILHSDSGDVYESHLQTGTNPYPLNAPDTVIGNLYTNDRLSGTSLSDVTIVGGTTDTLVSGQITVTTSQGNILVVDTTTGAYTYTLVHALDHSTAINNILTDSFTYTVKDSNGKEYSSHLDIAVHDDAPVINGDSALVVPVAAVNTNLLLTLDVSGSMGVNYVGVTHKTRFDVAKDALINTIHEYANAGNVNVNLTLFNATALNEGWMSSKDALTYLSNLTMNGINVYHNGGSPLFPYDYTNYEAGLQGTYTNYSVNLPTADKTVAFFISDGVPTNENNDNTANLTDATNYGVHDSIGSTYLDQPYLTTWNSFITNNHIDLSVIGISNSITPEAQNYLNEVQAVSGGTATIITDLTQLASAMVPAQVTTSGQLFESNGSAGINFGADGEHVMQLTYLGANNANDHNVAYTYDASNTTANPIQTIQLSGGESMDVNFKTGAFVLHTPVSSDGSDIMQNFSVSVSDTDGDTVTHNMNLLIAFDKTYTYDGTTPINAGAGIDTIDLSIGVNLTTVDFSKLDNIEIINLTPNGNHSVLNLTLSDVVSMTDSNHTLEILGNNSSDTVSLKNGTGTDAWTKSAIQTTDTSGHTFDVYTNSADSSVSVKVEDHTTHNII